MNLPKEYVLLLIIGLFLVAGVFDYIVEPLALVLPDPYYFFTAGVAAKFPFTTTSIIIKSAALFLSPLWIFSFVKKRFTAKSIILLVWSALTQLYAVQDVVTRAELIPLEWSLSLTASGFALLLPVVYFFIKAAITSAHRNLSNARMQEAIEKAEEKSASE